jgi:hypothetical protein
MATINTRLSLNGAQNKYDQGIRLAVEGYVRRELGYSDDYDVIININAMRVKRVTFAAGDVYQYRFNAYGPWYTYVRGQSAWGSTDMTDDLMRQGLDNSRARKCAVTPV